MVHTLESTGKSDFDALVKNFICQLRTEAFKGRFGIIAILNNIVEDLPYDKSAITYYLTVDGKREKIVVTDDMTAIPPITIAIEMPDKLDMLFADFLSLYV